MPGQRRSIVSTVSDWLVGLASFALIVFIGLIDHVTGYEISFSIFFLIPILVSVWYGDQNIGYVACFASAGAWMMVEKISALPYSQAWILYWNTGVRLTFFLVVAYLAGNLRANLERHRQLARTDSLTGLLNRPGFIERAAALVGASGRHRNATTIAFVDLDNFKQINDTRGHEQGDAVLAFVATQLSRTMRASDTVARFGGDEFAILLPNTNESGARVFLERLHAQALSAVRDQGWSELGLSIGAIVLDHGNVDLAEALHIADILMYRVKNSESAGVLIEAMSSRGTRGDAR
jgi:diguanylate cyclase (GGDEF)-like protein